MANTEVKDHPAARVPDRLFEDDSREARWRARFTAARISLPAWAEHAPAHALYASNASGVWELYAWDREADTHRQVTERPNGTIHGALSADGSRIWWFADTDGDEFGHWVAEPFDGGEPEAAVPEAPDGYPGGVAIGRKTRAVGVSTDEGSTVWLASEDEPAKVVYAHETDAGVAALSEDETLLAIGHSEHGDNRHPALRVYAAADGSVVAEKSDGDGLGLEAVGFGPKPGDNRLLVVHERRGREELLVWDVVRDAETEILLDLPGEVVADWYPDGSALLIVHTNQGRNTLHRFDLRTMRLTALPTPPGSIGAAGARPDGSVEYSWSAATTPSKVRSIDTDGADRVLLEPPGPLSPGSVAVTDAFVPTDNGTVHALIATPEGERVGAVFSVHGGPHAADEDRFSAYRAAWVDAGFAVVEVNYRGSTGYGSAWRDAIEGRPGLTELEDLAAVRDWACEHGYADADRCLLAGASWGGYLTLLGLGTQPQHWAAGVAVVPVADYVAAYEDEMEQLRAFDRALFGGSVAELPERYRDCSPLTYVDRVRAPVLIIAGENDPRCPIRQIINYLDRLAERGARYEVYRYDAGHGSLVVAESIKQTAIEIDFARRALEG